MIDVGDIEIGIGNDPLRKGSWGAPLGGRRLSNKKKSERYQINESDRESIPPIESYVESEEASISNGRVEEQKAPQPKEFDSPDMSFQRDRSSIKKGYMEMPSKAGSDMPREETESDIASHR